MRQSQWDRGCNRKGTKEKLHPKRHDTYMGGESLQELDYSSFFRIKIETLECKNAALDVIPLPHIYTPP